MYQNIGTIKTTCRILSFAKVQNKPTWKEDSDAMLDAALARFHKDWGGEKSPIEIANELRQGAEMVKEVGTW